MKGKYAARAANRLADFDNQLLQEERAKVMDLTAQLAEAKESLIAEQSQRNALVLDRAYRLSQRDIAQARHNTEQQITRHAANAERAAELLTADFQRQKRYPNNYIDTVLPLLIPDQLARSTHIDKFLGDEK